MLYVHHIIRRIIIWISVTFISLIVLFIVAFISSPPMIQPIIVKGAEQVAKTADMIESVMSNRSFSSTPQYIRIARSVLYVTLMIYMNNIRLNVLFSAPFIGGIIYGVILALNGWIGRYVAERIVGDKWYIVLACTLFASPHSYLEFLAYSIAVTESAILSLHIVKRRVGRRHLKQYAVYIAVSFIILLVAAVSEALIILLLNG